MAEFIGVGSSVRVGALALLRRCSVLMSTDADGVQAVDFGAALEGFTGQANWSGSIAMIPNQDAG